jgi:hypothetical protein
MELLLIFSTGTGNQLENTCALRVTDSSGNPEARGLV